MGKIHQRIINTRSWPSGTYYISVQTIDRNYLGSVFSPEATFEKIEPDNDFLIGSKNPLNLLDTVKFVVKNPIKGSGEHIWDFDGGRLVGTDESTGVYSVVYETPGDKHISLRTVDAQGRMSSLYGRDLTVSHSTLRQLPQNDIQAALDLDEDGVTEYYSVPWRDTYGGLRGGAFYQNDGKGGYEFIPKMFNSQNGVSKFKEDVLTVDINGDGKCDVWAQSGLDNKTVYQSINLGDMDMETSVLTSNFGNPWSRDFWLDFNNDGKYDAVSGRSVWLNDGTYAGFSSENVAAGDCFYDYDGDGLVDIMTSSISWVDGEIAGVVYVWLNQGDGTVRSGHMIPNGEKNTLKLIAADDFDNNGICDFIMSDRIVWDDGEITKLPLNSDYIAAPQDLDNNGFLDIPTKDFVLYFSEGRQFVVENYKGNDYGTNFSTAGGYFKGADGRLRNRTQVFNVKNEAPAAPTDLHHTKMTNLSSWSGHTQLIRRPSAAYDV